MTPERRIGRLRAGIRRGRRRIARILTYNRRRRRAIRRLIAEERARPAVMFDSVDLDQVPDNAPAVAGYVGGHWPTYPELSSRFPRARTLSIAVNAGEDAECLDVEPGDATPAEAAAWVKRQLARGVKRPVVYASASVMESVLTNLARAGIRRDQVRVWTAHYSFEPHLCGPHSCGLLQSTTADATQWTNRALGRNLDESRVSRGFFPW